VKNWHNCVAMQRICYVSGAETFFVQGMWTKNIKFCFSSKLPSICINQKYSVGVGQGLAHSQVIESKLGSGGEASDVKKRLFLLLYFLSFLCF